MDHLDAMRSKLRHLTSPGVGVILQLAQRLRCGRLEIVLPNGARHHVQGAAPGPAAVFILRHPRLARRFVTRGSLGFAEAYLDGDWDSPDLATLLELLDRNEEAFADRWYAKGLARWLGRWQHKVRANNRRGSRRNIRAHYDLGNAFYAAWLDPSLTYSAGLFETGVEDLETAQRSKYRRLAASIGLAEGHRLLEIGSGWGSFAITAARDFGARVTSVTVSKAQHGLASRRVFEAGLAERVEIRLQDYRDVVGRFDRVASIEMLEAVGERFWPLFFARLRERLAADGVAGLQTIAIADRHFETYRRSVDFIQKHVFPGGMLPCLAVLESQTARAGLAIGDRFAFGGSYARTLGEWNRRFQAAWPALQAQGFDDRFRRLWSYYLAYCEAGFRTRSTEVVQLTLRPS